jgi:DnaJ-like protein
MPIDIEEQLANLRLKILGQEKELTSLEQECNELEADMADFEERYNKIVKPIANQIEAAKSAVEKLRDLQLMQQMGEKLNVESLWHSETKTQATDEYPLPYDEILPSAEKAKGSRHSRIKKLYRQLARRYHPDLAKDEEERERRTKIMSLINTAYQEEDIESLEALNEATPRQQSEAIDSQTPLAIMLLRRLQQQFYDFAVRIRDLKVHRHNLRYGPMMELKLEESLAQARGEDLLTSLAEDMQQEYWAYVKELDELRQLVN